MQGFIFYCALINQYFHVPVSIFMNAQIQKQLSEQDEILKNIIAQMPYEVLESTGDVFQDLMSCIIEQQIHYRSSKKTFQRVLERAGIERITPENFSVVEERGLEKIKLSMSKYETLGRIVDFFQAQQLDWKNMENEEVRKTLKQIKGVGVWTIDMLLLYTLERPDIFPADDYHLKKIMLQLYDIDSTSRVKAQMKNIAERWSPYRSYGVKYLLAWKEFQK